MAVIRNRENNFRKYLEKHFQLVLPPDIEIFYARGVRVGNAQIRKCNISGEVGYAACDFGFNPTNSFIQNFGHLAKKNIVRLKDDEAREFAAGKDLKMDLGRKSKHVIVCYKEFVLGLAYFDNEKMKMLNKIPKKRARSIMNTI